MPRPNKGPRVSDEPNEYGLYEVRWSEKGRTKRVSTGCRSFPEAQRFFAGWLVEYERNERRRNDGTLTVGEVLDLYIEKHVETDKLASKETALNAIGYLRAHFGDMDVPDIEPDDVEKFVKLRRTGKLGWEEGGRQRGYRKAVDSSIRRELTVLIAAMNFAAKKKKIKRGDIPPIELPEGGQPRDRWLTHEEAQRLEEAAAQGWTPQSNQRMPRVYRFVVLALETAGRKAALEQLTWFQIDMEARKVALNPPGRRQTKKRRATVPMSTRLYATLQRAHNEKRTEHVLDHAGSTRKAFASAVKRAGLGDDVTPHVLRHTWATWAAQRGVPLWKIAGVLGDTYETVERNYLHHCPEHLRDAVEYHRGGELEPADEPGETRA